jgi:uncharacterized damage-inducible protein DinB
MKKIVFAAVISAVSLLAQGRGGPVSMSADLNQKYNAIKNNITKAAEAMPEDGYSLQPSKEERNFGAWVAHVADSQAGGCSGIAGARKNIGAASKTSKADLIAALKESFDICDPVYSGTTDANINEMVASFGGQTPRAAALYGTIIHDNECYGNMAVYLRLKGIVPPSTEAMQAGRGGRGGGRGRQ